MIRRQRTARATTAASYRSGIYYVDEEQKRIAEDTIADVDASGLWDGKVVTEVEPVGDFWEAEPEHQDYLEKRPGGYTCHFPRAKWVLPSVKTLATPRLRPARRRNRYQRQLRLSPLGRTIGPASTDGAGPKPS